MLGRVYVTIIPTKKTEEKNTLPKPGIRFGGLFAELAGEIAMPES